MAKTLTWSMAAVAAVWLAATPVASLAQGAPASPPAAADGKLALARELMVAIDARGTMRRVMEAMTDAMSRGFADASGDKAVAKVLQDTTQEELANMTRQALPMMAQVYVDTFSEQELRDLLAFYQSPLGRKLIEKGPELSQRSQAAIAPLIPVMQKDMLVKMFSRICAAKHCSADELRTMQQVEKQMIERLDAQIKGPPTT